MSGSAAPTMLRALFPASPALPGPDARRADPWSGWVHNVPGRRAAPAVSAPSGLHAPRSLSGKSDRPGARTLRAPQRDIASCASVDRAGSRRLPGSSAWGSMCTPEPSPSMRADAPGRHGVGQGQWRGRLGVRVVAATRCVLPARVRQDRTTAGHRGPCMQADQAQPVRRGTGTGAGGCPSGCPRSAAPAPPSRRRAPPRPRVGSSSSPRWRPPPSRSRPASSALPKRTS